MEKKKKFTRITAMGLAFTILIALIIWRLADLQIVNGEKYRDLAFDKSIRTISDDAPRGKILDRNGIELAANKQSYAVFMMKPQDEQDEKSLEGVIEDLLAILNKDGEEINDSFPISITALKDGKYAYKFDFSRDAASNQKQQIQWKKSNNIPAGDTAEEAFNLLAKRYGAKPSQKIHDSMPFIRQMLVVNQAIHDKGYMSYEPVEIAYISHDTAFELMEKSPSMPGVDVRLEPLRTYPFGELASLVIGGLRKIPAEQAQEYKDKGYDLDSDLIGSNGIEAYAEQYLKGEKGETTVRVNALGQVSEQLGVKEATAGDNVVLTIDKKLQEAAEKSLDQVMKNIRTGNGYRKYPNATRGAAVVMNVNTSEILAMASRPGGFDPNQMAEDGSISQDEAKKLYPSADDYPGILSERIPKPMFNYATQGAVPPGSTFKMVTATAGLETGKISPSEIIVDRGRYTVVPGFNGACWLWNEYHGAHGALNLSRAIQVSCNYFFFEVGRRVGLNAISKYAAMYGLADQPTGIEISESPGDVTNIAALKQTAVALVSKEVLSDITKPNYDKSVGTFTPTDAQKKLIVQMMEDNDKDSDKLKDAGITSYRIRRRILDGIIQVYYEYAKPGLVLDAAIGQGNDRFTPLQIASYMSILANGGTRYKPHLVKEIVSPDGTVVQENKPQIVSKLDVKPSTFAAIKVGMNKVVDDGGTAARAFVGFPIKTAGKTGTAQASGKMDDYSWFTGYAPLDKPEIAVAVVIYEGGGQGGADVARAIYSQYFGLAASK